VQLTTFVKDLIRGGSSACWRVIAQVTSAATRVVSNFISKSNMTQRRAANTINNTQGEADKVSFDLEME
jgi:hypothetical protein